MVGHEEPSVDGSKGAGDGVNTPLSEDPPIGPAGRAGE